MLGNVLNFTDKQAITVIELNPYSLRKLLYFSSVNFKHIYGTIKLNQSQLSY